MKNKFIQHEGNIYSLDNVLSVKRSTDLVVIAYRDIKTESAIYCSNERSAKKFVDAIFEALGN